MRTCIIQKNNAPDSLIRFTEVGCLFNYENKWLDYFQDIIITDNADSIPGPAWRINAGQFITTKTRSKFKHLDNVDLRNDDMPLYFDPRHWSTTNEMKQYRGMKQEYIFRNHMVMVLKSKKRMIYFSNNEHLPALGNVKDIWVPASGDMAGRIQHLLPDANITIYDINPAQLEYSKWLNSRKSYPSEDEVKEFTKSLGKISVAERFFPGIQKWTPARAEYMNLDIIETQLTCPTIISNILKYMPVYHKHGFEKIKKWREKNLHLTL